MSSPNLVTVIAAGGSGTRMRADRPKSLLRVCGRTLLEHTLQAVVGNGSSMILVYNNRRSWDDHIGEIIGKYSEARLVRDSGVESTVELATDAARRTHGSRLCFLYGHAPRSEDHLRRLWAGPEEIVAATRVARSSKVHAIGTADAFLEPPYVLPTELLRDVGCNSWQVLFSGVKTAILTVPVAGPGEANWPAEMRLYRRYIRSRFRPNGGGGHHSDHLAAERSVFGVRAA